VAKAPQLAAIACGTITTVCLVRAADIKFVQRAWETGKAAQRFLGPPAGTEARTRRIKGRNQRFIGERRGLRANAFGDIKNKAGSTRGFGAAFQPEGGIFLFPFCVRWREIHTAVQRKCASILPLFFPPLVP
jgi:hypothetical protein